METMTADESGCSSVVLKLSTCMFINLEIDLVVNSRTSSLAVR